VLNKYIELCWLISFLIIQLCTEKIDMTYYFYVIDWADSSWCLYNLSIQTVHYVLMKCLQTQNLRKKLLRQVNDTKKILWDSALVKAVTIFMLWSNLLRQFQTVKETLKDLKLLRSSVLAASMKQNRTSIRDWVKTLFILTAVNILSTSSVTLLIRTCP